MEKQLSTTAQAIRLCLIKAKASSCPRVGFTAFTTVAATLWCCFVSALIRTDRSFPEPELQGNRLNHAHVKTTLSRPSQSKEVIGLSSSLLKRARRASRSEANV